MSLLTTLAGMSEEREAWAYDWADAYHPTRRIELERDLRVSDYGMT